MRALLFSSFFLLFSLQAPCIAVDIANEDYKKTIEQLNAAIAAAPAQEKGTLQAQLAVVLYKDQEQEKAFRLFLELLDAPAASVTPYQPSAEESAAYDAALKIYLSHNSPKENAEELKKNYMPVIKEHPDYLLVGFLLSAAYANLGEFNQFFPTFYRSYQSNPDHYLAFKSKAALHIKLMERARTAEERERQQQLVLANAQAALERYPNDTGLYKLILTFTKDENRPAVVDAYLRKIIDNNIVIARADIAFYVQQAVAADRIDLAQEFINKAREWYAFSKVIDAAQQYLDQKRAGSASR